MTKRNIKSEVWIMKLFERSYILAACNDYIGYCTHCRDFTRDATEPDAEGYNCPECENNDVIGAEDALLTGLIGFK